MIISLNWLSHWVDLSNIEVDELVETLSVSGLEVASVQSIGRDHDKIVVGKIVEISPHPKADRLVVCTVDAGESSPRTIVCGAKNMKAGDCVPVALPSSQPPGIDFEIGERKVMGVPSAGMLCAKEELGLAESSDGLWILPPQLEASIGQPIFDAMDITDTLLEIEVTPNRPDALSHRGVARDVAALFNRKLFDAKQRLEKIPAFNGLSESASTPVNASPSVAIETEHPVHYGLALIDNVTVCDSPEWLQLALAKSGLRPINLVVDLTNFIMLDVGQPLHAFDSRVASDHIVVRNAKEGESFSALNHKEYTLKSTDLLISNRTETPLALAGVMGGLESEVTNSTTRILLECAYFCPTAVRKTAKRLALHSDSSHRYERGMDPIAIPHNLEYALSLFGRLLNFKPDFSRSVIGHNLASTTPTVIRFELSEYQRIIGEPIAIEKVEEILTRLGFTVDIPEGISGVVQVTVPGFRPDVTRPIDLVEELVRIIGLNSIEGRSRYLLSGDAYQTRHEKDLPSHVSKTLVPRKKELWINRLRENLLSRGLYELVSYSFMSEEALDLFEIPADDHRRSRVVKIVNPLTVDYSHMRTFLVPSFLTTAQLNLGRRHFDQAYFEIARVYFQGSEEGSADLAQEPLKLGIWLTGRKSSHFSLKSEWDFYDLKGMLEDLFDDTDLSLNFLPPEDDGLPYLHPGVQATIELVRGASTDSPERLQIGEIGRLHPKLTSEFQYPVYYAELELDPLRPSEHQHQTLQSSSKFQSVSRDFAFVVPKSIRWADIEKSLYNAVKNDSQLAMDFRSCMVFDVYEGEQVEDGHRSIALTVSYQSATQTLTDEDISRYDQLILSSIESDLGLTLRL